VVSDADIKPSLEAIKSLKLNMGSVRNWGEGELEAVKEAIKSIRELVSCELERKIITLRLGPADERLAEVLPVLSEAFRIAKEFVSAAKRRARVLDYADLEVHALKALEHRGTSLLPREVASLPGGRVSGHEPRAVRAAQQAHQRGQADGGRRREAVHIWL